MIEGKIGIKEISEAVCKFADSPLGRKAIEYIENKYSSQKNNLRFEKEKIEYVGGTYKECREYTTENKLQNTEVHHIPANDVNGMNLSDGPAIIMDKADHMKTASWGNSKEARAYREKQGELIKNGDFKAAFEMDVKDIHSKFGCKYDKVIEQARAKIT